MAERDDRILQKIEPQDKNINATQKYIPQAQRVS